MKRKLVSQGRATLTISLPSKWLKTFGLKAGDDIEVEEKGTNLVIKTEKGVTIEKTQVDVQNYGSRLLEKVLVYLYRKGYDEIEFILENPEQVAQIQDIIALGLLGYEVVSHGQRSCVVKNISGAIEGEFDQMLRRTFLLLKSMAYDGMVAIKTKKPEALQNLILSEKINNRLTTIARRVINKKGFDKDSTFLYSLINYLEKMADDYRDMYKYIKEKKPKLTAQELKLMEAVNENFNRMYENYYKFDKSTAIKIQDEYKKLTAELEKEFENKKANTKIIHHLLGILDKTVNCTYFTFALKL